MSDQPREGGATRAPEGYGEYQSIALTRSSDGILVVRLHSDGGPLEFSMPSHLEWTRLWREIGDDEQTRVVIITGTGDSFMSERKALPGGSDRKNVMTTKYWQFIMRECKDMVVRFLDMPQIVISAINGPVRSHAEIALFGDVVLCTPDTYIMDTHMPEQVIPTDLQHVLIPALIGRVRAGYFFLTDQRIGAEEAQRMGMVNEIVPRELLFNRSVQLARWMLRQPDANLKYLKRMLTHEIRGQMHAMLEYGLAVEGLAAMGADWSDWKLEKDGPGPIDSSATVNVAEFGLPD